MNDRVISRNRTKGWKRTRFQHLLASLESESTAATLNLFLVSPLRPEYFDLELLISESNRIEWNRIEANRSVLIRRTSRRRVAALGSDSRSFLIFSPVWQAWARIHVASFLDKSMRTHRNHRKKTQRSLRVYSAF